MVGQRLGAISNLDVTCSVGNLCGPEQTKPSSHTFFRALPFTMEKCGAIFPITFEDCGRSHAKSPPPSVWMGLVAAIGRIDRVCFQEPRRAPFA